MGGGKMGKKEGTYFKTMKGIYDRRKKLEEKIEELNNKLYKDGKLSVYLNKLYPNQWTPETITQRQIDYIKKLSEERNVRVDIEQLRELTRGDASQRIDELKEMKT